MPDRSLPLGRLYDLRFDPADRARKARVWEVLCRDFFQRYVHADDTVLDVGAGHCEFINHIRCRRKLALDLSEDLPRHAAPDVELIQEPSTAISSVSDEVVDVAFASNFFEHLRTKDDLWRTLAELRRVLRPGGRLLVLQPNVRYVGGAYWDFIDHHLPLTERSLLEALRLVGFEPVEVRARFLPFTTRSAWPQHPLLVRLYLRLPLVQRLVGRQSWIVARKATAPAGPTS
jgi:SAM-dependent methyltransferase